MIRAGARTRWDIRGVGLILYLPALILGLVFSFVVCFGCHSCDLYKLGYDPCSQCWGICQYCYGFWMIGLIGIILFCLTNDGSRWPCAQVAGFPSIRRQLPVVLQSGDYITALRAALAAMSRATARTARYRSRRNWSDTGLSRHGAGRLTLSDTALTHRGVMSDVELHICIAVCCARDTLC